MQSLRLYLVIAAFTLNHFADAQTQFLPIDPPFSTINPMDMKAINLDVFNPVYNFIGNKSRKTTEQEWLNNTWFDLSKFVTIFSANCDKPVRRIRSAYRRPTEPLEEVGLDTFIYENNRLSIYKKYFDGRFIEQYRFVYNGTRNSPDTVWASSFTELMRYSYTYSGNQITAITEDAFASTSVFPNRRIKLIYTANGQLKQYLSEKNDNGIWKKIRDDNYAYDSLNRLKKYTQSSASSPTITEGSYVYNNQNQLFNIDIFIKNDTLPTTQILKFIYSNYNSQSRPRQVEFQMVQGVMQAPLFLYTYAYEANDSTLNRILMQQTNGPGAFVNYSQTLYESCGSTLAITEKRPENVSINVFPNPANEEIYIKTNELSDTLFDVSIFNASGQVVQKTKDTFLHRPFIIRDLSNGIYFIRLSSPQITGVQSFVVRR